ncbi:MAG: hypothetical protein ACKOCN_08370, partial [Planctomycetaceae bacterium]
HGRRRCPPTRGRLLAVHRRFGSQSPRRSLPGPPRLFPGAVAEDMEGFGVAMACRLVGVPLTIVRGISNIAGDRDTRQWRIRESLAAAADLTSLLLGGQAGCTT